MIITVTLNAALDKTLEVPSFTPGRRHRTVDQTTMAGGKGVNVARAIKALGQPVIATGLTGGATGNRIIESLGVEAVLNGFVRIREESRTNTAVLDPTTGMHTEINERGPAVSPTELDLFREKLLYLAKGASICVFAGSLPASDGSRRLRQPDPRGEEARGDDDRRHRGRATAAGDAGRAGPRLAERAGGRGARRSRVQRRPRSRAGGGRDLDARRGRGDHDGARRVLCPGAGGRIAGSVPGAGGEAGRPVGDRVRGRLPRRLRRRPVRGSQSRSTACASASRAGPSRPSTSAPGSSIRPGSSGCSARWNPPGSSCPPKCADCGFAPSGPSAATARIDGRWLPPSEPTPPTARSAVLQAD